MKSLDELEHQLTPLSVKEAAKIYGDSPSNFYRLIRRGEVPGVFRKTDTPKARIKICPREFVAWLRGQIAACCKARNAALRNQSKGTGTTSSTVGREQETSLDDDNSVKKRKKEGRVA